MNVRPPITFPFLFTSMAAALLTLVSFPGQAQTLRTWSGGGADNNWSSVANWSGGAAPVAGDPLIFAGTNRRTNVNDLDLTGTPGIGGATFSSANWHLSGSALTMQIGKGFTNSQAGSVIWDMDTTLGAANGTIWVRLGNGGASMVFPKVISGAASRILRKEAGANATGKLSLLNPANTFLGNIYLGSGPSEFVTIANAGQPSSLGAASSTTAATIFVGSTGTAFGTDSSYVGTTDGETDRVIEFQGRTTVGFNNNSSTNNLTFNGNWLFRPSTTPPRLILGGTSTGTNTVNGSLSQAVTTLSFGLDVNGPTTWVFNGPNSILGDVRFRTGKHYLGGSASISTTNIVIDPGAVLDVSAFPNGCPIGQASGQILKAGRPTDPATDIVGGLDLGYLGTINIGGIGTPATLKMSGTMRAQSGLMIFDVSDSPAGSNDLLEVAGDLDVSGWTTLNVNPYKGELQAGVPYTLIKYSGALIGSATGLNVPPPARTFVASVSTATPNEIRVTFNPSGQSAANLVWQGYSPYWDVNLNQSWLKNGTPDFFQQLDAVTFNDVSAATYTLDISGVVAPASVTVDTTNTFTFQGGGSISGGSGMVISKKGSGTLKIMTPNILAGPVQVSAGTVLGGTSTSLGTGSITLGDQSTGTNDIRLLLSSAATTPNPVTVANNGTGKVTLGRETGGSVTFAGPVTIERAVEVHNPGPWAAGNRVYISGLISGTGDLTFSGGGYHTLNPATANTFTGKVAVVDAGTMLQIDGGTGLPETCNVEVGEGAIFQPYGSLSINSLSGTGYVQSVSGTHTLTVGAANGDSSFSGTFRHNTQGGTAGILRLRKAGTGKLTLTGDNSGSFGGTIVAAGTLAVNNETGFGLGTGSLQIDAEGVLAGAGSINTSNNNAVVTGKLSVGNADDLVGADFYVTNSAALAFDGGTLEVDLFSGAGAGDNTGTASAADLLVADCAVTLNGATLTVGNPKTLTGWAVGDKWKIANWLSVPQGTFSNFNLPALSAGLEWDLSELYLNGMIAVKVGESRPVIMTDFSGGALTLTWSGGGVLQCSPEASGTYTNITGATSPYVINDLNAPRAFYRLLQQ